MIAVTMAEMNLMKVRSAADKRIFEADFASTQQNFTSASISTVCRTTIGEVSAATAAVQLKRCRLKVECFFESNLNGGSRCGTDVCFLQRTNHHK